MFLICLQFFIFMLYWFVVAPGAPDIFVVFSGIAQDDLALVLG